MQILAIERELAQIDPQRHEDVLREEAAVVWELEKAGVIRALWFTRDDRRAVVLLECATADEARRRLARLPLARAGLIDFELLPLRSYDGFDRLLRAAEESKRARYTPIACEPGSPAVRQKDRAGRGRVALVGTAARPHDHTR